MTRAVDRNPPRVQRLAYLSRRGWMALAGIAAIYETLGIARPQKHDTISETTRWIFGTETTAGAVVFGGAWCAFAIWMPAHILKLGRGRK